MRRAELFRKRAAGSGVHALSVLLSGIGFGMGLMFLLDPAVGRRRRALAHDRLLHRWHTFRGTGVKYVHDLFHRGRGAIAEAASLLRGEHEVDDDVLAARVRSQIGHVVRHASLVTTSVQNGRVTISGPVLANEADELLACVAAIRGVRGQVASALEVYAHERDLPGVGTGDHHGGDGGEERVP